MTFHFTTKTERVSALEPPTTPKPHPKAFWLNGGWAVEVFGHNDLMELVRGRQVKMLMLNCRDDLPDQDWEISFVDDAPVP